MPQPPRSRVPSPRRRRVAVPASPPSLRIQLLWFGGLLLALAVLAVLLPERVGAQITTGLTPPEPRPSPTVVARAESTVVAARDSAAKAERLDLKAWVDSAAASLEAGAEPQTPGLPGDSLAPPPGTARPGTARPGTPRPGTPRPGTPRPGTPRPGRPPREPGAGSRGGLPAPDTATPLPLLVALGGAMAGSGIWLRRRR